MDVTRVCCRCCCGSSWVPVCLCANDICKRHWFAMLNCFQTLNNNKINYVGPRFGTWLILTVSQLLKSLTHSWSTEDLKQYKKEKSDTHSLIYSWIWSKSESCSQCLIESNMRVIINQVHYPRLRLYTFFTFCQNIQVIKVKKGNVDLHSFSPYLKVDHFEELGNTTGTTFTAAARK